MLGYGFFEWVFWVLAFGAGALALTRGEVFSSHSSQRVRGHAGQQIFLWMATAAFALAGFVTAVLALRAGH
ncbi:hypothetical protein [Arthrobacter sp. TWP1-1]|uniref:hypothetical protein n=1 Tax=Arthrobacter sp. TWP1-1 TaxID=2804568 RepID=UPI003CF78DF8